MTDAPQVDVSAPTSANASALPRELGDARDWSHSPADDVPGLVSVVMTAFNRAHLIPRAWASLRAQSYDRWELIVVDDGSTDNTAQLVQDMMRDDARVRFVTQPNAGLAHARNAGLLNARGEWCTFLDSDDAYEPEHLALRVAAMRAHPDVALLHGGLRIVGGDDHVPDRNRPGERIAIADCFVGGTFFFRRSLARDFAGFRRPNFGDDYDFMTRIQPHVVVGRVHVPTYIYYRDTPDGMCNTHG